MARMNKEFTFSLSFLNFNELNFSGHSPLVASVLGTSILKDHIQDYFLDWGRKRFLKQDTKSMKYEIKC